MCVYAIERRIFKKGKAFTTVLHETAFIYEKVIYI